MVRDITDEEVKLALFSIGEEKSLGLDGYTYCFFKKAWGTIGVKFTIAIKDFFLHRRLLKHINHLAIALIEKSNHASTVQDFRPISCCNVIYKAIFKIIVYRLKPCFDTLINPAHLAFIKQRSMIDNVYLVQELVRKYARRRVSPRCMIKVDLRKAYDSISWSFLQDFGELRDVKSLGIKKCGKVGALLSTHLSYVWELKGSCPRMINCKEMELIMVMCDGD
ncbi:uncharacterized protein LOC131158661 [Malania oleifera]|uniref:uncharacterized protein LOC131158661 n=1 Tax=Malania oleifera TaxID=397392 RepID=UPI0025ADBC8B|nr:uncharacterized protein LOC131158661 [Malania oleifera]